jgi:hypothetical protein
VIIHTDRSVDKPEPKKPRMKDVIALYPKRFLLLFVFGGALLFHRAQAAPLCTHLPPSTLQLLVSVPEVRESLESVGTGGLPGSNRL